MRASELMARAENALRTGQTENLFPVIARRCLELIEEERQANRREWAALDVGKRIEFAVEGMVSAFVRFGMSVAEASGALMAFARIDAVMYDAAGMTIPLVTAAPVLDVAA